MSGDKANELNIACIDLIVRLITVLSMVGIRVIYETKTKKEKKYNTTEMSNLILFC